MISTLLAEEHFKSKIGPGSSRGDLNYVMGTTVALNPAKSRDWFRSQLHCSMELRRRQCSAERQKKK